MGLNNPELTERLQNFLSIRMAQEAGSGVPEDNIERDRAFSDINAILEGMGQQKVARQEDLG
jgi:hypothetical protein